jgi:hypothetical protein
MHLTKACKSTELLPYVKPGLAALGTDAGHIELKWQGSCHESANFEKYVKAHVSQNVTTWDYLVSAGSSVRHSRTHALEVHRCEPDEAHRVIDKKRWSEDHLANKCPDVDVERWVWIASGTTLILEGISPEHFLVSQEGIEMVSRMGYRP